MTVCLTRLLQRPITWQLWQQPRISITRTWRKWVHLHVENEKGVNKGRIDNPDYEYVFVFFHCSISKVCGGDLPYVSPDSLEEKHHFNFKEALYTFSSTKKMGGQEFCDRYQAQLEKELEEMWQSFSKHNEVKRLLCEHDITVMPVFKKLIFDIEINIRILCKALYVY